MNEINSTHIQVTVTCPDCGHTWDIEDYDSMSAAEAEAKAAAEPCPECPPAEGDE